MAGGKFLERRRVKKPDQELLKGESSECFEAQDLYVGAQLCLHQYEFQLVDADEFTLNYLEQHAKEVWTPCPPTPPSSAILLSPPPISYCLYSYAVLCMRQTTEIRLIKTSVLLKAWFKCKSTSNHVSCRVNNLPLIPLHVLFPSLVS